MLSDAPEWFWLRDPRDVAFLDGFDVCFFQGKSYAKLSVLVIGRSALTSELWEVRLRRPQNVEWFEQLQNNNKKLRIKRFLLRCFSSSTSTFLWLSLWIICFLLVNKSSNCKRLCCSQSDLIAFKHFASLGNREMKNILTIYIRESASVSSLFNCIFQLMNWFCRMPSLCHKHLCFFYLCGNSVDVVIDTFGVKDLHKKERICQAARRRRKNYEIDRQRVTFW